MGDALWRPPATAPGAAVFARPTPPSLSDGSSLAASGQSRPIRPALNLPLEPVAVAISISIFGENLQPASRARVENLATSDPPPTTGNLSTANLPLACALDCIPLPACPTRPHFRRPRPICVGWNQEGGPPLSWHFNDFSNTGLLSPRYLSSRSFTCLPPAPNSSPRIPRNLGILTTPTAHPNSRAFPSSLVSTS